MSISQDSTTSTVVLEFSENVISALRGDPDAMVGFVDFDIDQNSATGSITTVDEYRGDGGSSDMGVEFRLALGDFIADSTMSVTTPFGQIVGRVRPQFLDKSVTVRIPNSLIGNPAGLIRAVAIVGISGRPTDFIPNAGHLATKR
jgi:hypothetical protein